MPGLTGARAGVEQPQIIVQPNFDIVFLAAAPAAEAEIAPFAERRGSGVGTLFRITRDAVFAAAAAGISADAALESLTRLSTKPVPPTSRARSPAGSPPAAASRPRPRSCSAVLTRRPRPARSPRPGATHCA